MNYIKDMLCQENRGEMIVWERSRGLNTTETTSGYLMHMYILYKYDRNRGLTG